MVWYIPQQSGKIKSQYLPMFQLLKYPFPAITFIIMALSMISCTTTKKVVYLNDLTDTTAGSLRKAQTDFENPIQKNIGDHFRKKNIGEI